MLIVDENQSDGRIRTTKVYDIDSGKAAQTLSGEIWSATVGFTAESRNALLYRSLGTCCGYDFAYWGVTTGAKLRKVTPPFEIDSIAEIAPSNFVITGGPDQTPKAIRFDASSGQFSQPFAIDGSQKNIVRARGSTILATDSSGTLSLWDATTGARQVKFYYFQDGEWLAITAEGFFAGSPAARRRINVIRGVDATSIDQFFQSLYRPDLVREKLAGDPRGLVRQAAASLDLEHAVTSGNPPDVRLTTPSRGLSIAATDLSTISVQAEVTDRGGGIERIEWRVNGVTAGIDNPAPPAAGQLLQLSRSLALDAGDNSIEVVAYNRANLVASLPARTSVAASQPAAAPASPAPGIALPPATAPSAAAKPRLFVLVAGVNAYADQRIRLDYAVPDAKAVAQAFREAAGNLYQSVDVKLMTDTEVTRGRLDAAFTELAGKILPSDVFVLYLAGHGKTVDGRYYFIPQDLTIDGEFSNASIDASVKSKAIAQDQLQRWFAEIPARKSMILFDTCDSGTLTGDGAETQQLEREAANDRLAQATGRSIITASAGSQAALEGYHGHGLFTYELLDGLGHADSDGNGTVEVAELAAFAYAGVVELSQKVFQRRQVPQMKLTVNYPLAKQTQVLADAATPVAAAGPAYHVAQTAQVQIQPGRGATVMRSLSANTAVRVIESRDGWSLIARDGRPLGYVATRDLAPSP